MHEYVEYTLDQSATTVYLSSLDIVIFVHTKPYFHGHLNQK